jgi:hypothetical protein
MRRHALLCALAVTSVGLVGCGDDGGRKVADGGGLVDRRSVDAKVGDFQLADAAVIQLSDLPGWKVGTSDEDADGDKAFLDCVDPPHREVFDNEDAEAEREYKRADATLYSTANVYPSEAYAAESFGLVRNERFLECFRSTLETQLTQEAAGSDPSTEVSVQIERLPDPALGDEAAAIRVDIVLSGPGGQRHMVYDTTDVRVGRVEASIGSIELDRSLDPTLVDQLLDLTLERITTV